MHELRKLKDLSGYRLQAVDGEIGRVEDVYFDDQRWQVRYLVIKTGSWLLGRQVLLVPDVMGGIDDENQAFEVNLSCEQIKNAPPVDTDQPVSAHYQQLYHRYYSWEPYWSNDPLFQAPPVLIPPSPTEEGSEPDNPHLRSSREVTGYQLEAEDGGVGHVEDFVLDDSTWSVRYLEIDTRNWLPGRHVLMSPAWVDSIDWSTRQVKVGLAKDLVKTAPPYDPASYISRAYQLALYKHYGKVFLE